MIVTSLYDFSGNMQGVFALALTALHIPAYTPQTAVTFQKQRPRSEVVFHPGGSVNPPRIALVNGLRRIAAYTGELTITSITNASSAGKMLHALYTSTVREAMELDRIRGAANIASNPYTIDFVLPTGSSETYASDNGYELSRLTYTVEFSIKTDAFAQLG